MLLAYASLFNPLRFLAGDFIYTALWQFCLHRGGVSCTRKQDTEKRSETSKITSGSAYLIVLAVTAGSCQSRRLDVACSITSTLRPGCPRCSR
jgi:hypothetical protein